MNYDNLTNDVKPGVYYVKTLSNTVYELTITGTEKFLKRMPSEDAEPLRRDTEKIKIIEISHLVVGESAIFVLEPLFIVDEEKVKQGLIPRTTRFTTDVIEIWS